MWAGRISRRFTGRFLIGKPGVRGAELVPNVREVQDGETARVRR